MFSWHFVRLRGVNRTASSPGIFPRKLSWLPPKIVNRPKTIATKAIKKKPIRHLVINHFHFAAHTSPLLSGYLNTEIASILSMHTESVESSKKKDADGEPATTASQLNHVFQ